MALITHKMRMAEFISFLISCCITITVVNTSPIGGTEHADTRSKGESSALKKLLNSNKVIHIKSKDILSGKLKEKMKSLSHVKSEVLEKRNIMAVDLSDTKGTAEEKKFEEFFLKTFAVYFPAELIIISHHKNELMFSTIEDMKHPHFSVSEKIEEIFVYHEEGDPTEPANIQASKRDHRIAGTTDLPTVTFNWQLYKGITEADNFCTWGEYYPMTGYRNKPSHYLCSQKAGIWLIFEVSAFRSLNDDTLASNIPDYKFIRISSVGTYRHGTGGGGGFSLNKHMETKEDSFRLKDFFRNNDSPAGRLEVDVRRKMSSLFASAYEVHIEGDGKVFLQYSTPNNPVNKETTYAKESSETVGISVGAGISKDGPSGSVGLEASSTNSKSIAFTYKEFDLLRGATNQSITYTYVRNEKSYPKESTYEEFDSNIRNIEPIGYSGFIPKFDVSFIADPKEMGKTTFNITTGILATWLSVHVFDTKHERAWWSTLSPINLLIPDEVMHLKDHRRFQLEELMTVDWSHPVFTGYRPVFLQSTYFGDERFDVRENGEIYMNKGDVTSLSQSFIYSSSGLYESVSNRGQCLDSRNLETLQSCDSASLYQRWFWERTDPDARGYRGYTNYLKMLSKREEETRLAVNKADGKLVMVKPSKPGSADNDKVEEELLTGETEVYHQDWLHEE